MARRCSAVGCSETATIVEPLDLDTLQLQVPLCATHDKEWLAFADRRRKALRESRVAGRIAEWTLDAAMAQAAFPPEHR